MNSRVALLLLLAVTASCDRGSRVVKSCPDGQKDCDGSCRNLVADDANCGSCGVACSSGSRCAGGQCLPVQCSATTPCAAGHVCSAGQCIARGCVGVICKARESCVDGACLVQDCATKACPAGFACVANACTEATCSGVTCPLGQQCRDGACSTTACSDGVQNGLETAVDCGGPCPKCADHSSCLEAGDCQSGVCSNGSCLAPSCSDGVKNQGETGLDCGGPACFACPAGQPCASASDCDSAICTTHVCQGAACADHVKNGSETDVDCGGVACPACALGQACAGSADCSSGLCAAHVCLTKPMLAILSTASGDEGTSIPLAVTLSPAVGIDVTFAYATSDGTALAGTDFTPSSAMGTIAAGATSTTLAIATTARALYQGDRAFTVTLSTPTNATLANASATVTIKETAAAPPTSLTYSPNAVTCTVNAACAVAAPAKAGGGVVSFTATGLPAGMTINASTGAISGAPTAIAPATDCTVTATNSGGAATAKVTITVKDVAPSITYAPSTQVCTAYSPCTFAAPTNTGGAVVSFTAPGLPAGMSINAATGAISGAPTTASAATNYTVTATNSGGTATATINIKVNQAPPNITLYPSDLSCTLYAACSLGAPVNAGGVAASFSLVGTLPAGLTFDASTGVISGTPTVVWSVTSYNVTATNAMGSSTVHVTVEVLNSRIWALWRIPDEATVFCSVGLVVAACPAVATASYGQDGNYLINVPTYTVDAIKGTVQDSVTGLMWERTVDARTFTMTAAPQYCSGLTQGGYTGWRLPTRVELQSIVNYGRYYPAIAAEFPATPPEQFWTSSIVAGPMPTNQLWYVSFAGGDVGTAWDPATLRVRCVR